MADVAKQAEELEVLTVDVQAQVEKFGADALATIDRLQKQNRLMRHLLMQAAMAMMLQPTNRLIEKWLKEYAEVCGE